MVSRSLLISLLIGVVLYPCRLSAQKDTVILDRFVVQGSQRSELRDFSNQPIDTLRLMATRTGSLADLLAQSSPVTMRYYGPGQLASASFRGASASQTVVVWNGIRINSPMMMQSDLASIPVHLISHGTLAFGSATLEYASGAFGGVVALMSEIEAGEKPEISVAATAGSFGYISGHAALTLKFGKLLSQTSVYQEFARNNYPYPDNFSGISPYPTEKRLNAGYKQRGIVQQIMAPGRKGWRYQAAFWYQDNQREIPYPIHQPQGKYEQSQNDKDLRMMFLASTRIREAAILEIRTGYQAGLMHFIDERSVTDATHSIQNMQQGVTMYGRINGWSWRTLAEYELQQVNSDAYNGPILRHIAASFAEILKDDGRKFTYGLSGRMEVIPGYNLSVIPALTAGYYPGDSRKHLVRVMVMRNRQIPGLNDLYWVPGGNLDLKPEKGPSVELGYERKPVVIGLVTLTPKVMAYYQQIENKIRWMPDSTTLWSAVNIGQVQMKGIESMLRATLKWHKTHFEGSAGIQVTSASRLSDKAEVVSRQLPYQPLISAAFSLIANAPFMVLAIENTLTGKQYTNIDNTSWLPSYNLTNVKILTKKYDRKHVTLQGSFNLYNLFDRKYQAIAWYPMPGISFRTGIDINLKP
jgi:vitamin B12 transporter